jgi:hypothetical protein
VDDFGVNIDLSDFFSTISNEKKKKKEEFNSIVGEINLNNIFEEVSTLKKENKEKKIKEEETLIAFESLLLSEKQPKTKKKKVEKIAEELTKQKNITEKSLGFLSEPSEIKQQTDPLTPLNQNFATLDDLQNHYKLFLNRIQQQLSTLGGGGETRLEFLR